MVKREDREKRKEKRMRKKKWLQTQALELSRPEGDGLRKRVHSEDNGGDDWAELAREERMAKKVKRGDISQKTFDEEFVDL
jgi:ATP-dependent RNA helicase DDX55/SPB4